MERAPQQETSSVPELTGSESSSLQRPVFGASALSYLRSLVVPWGSGAEDALAADGGENGAPPRQGKSGWLQGLQQRLPRLPAVSVQQGLQQLFAPKGTQLLLPVTSLDVMLGSGAQKKSWWPV